MLIERVVNHMDVDELRNFVTHLQRVDDARGNLVFSQNEVIETLQRLYNNHQYREECRIGLECNMGALREFERSMEEKYAEFMPVPACVCDGGCNG